jgi:hypothetical protein
MLRFALLAIALLIFISVAVALIVTAVICLVLACAVGIPLYLMSKPFLQRHGIAKAKMSPMDRLKTLYVEGKIDLFEFERRIARLISVEHF